MTLYFIGIGLSDEKDVSVKGLEIIRSCSEVYLENYTSKLNVSVEQLEEFYGKKVTPVNREFVEKNPDEMIDKAEKEDVAFLVVGDIFSATTHPDLYLRAEEKGVKCGFIHNASIINSISIVGLEIYKYGKTTSLPYWEKNFEPETAYDAVRQNRENNLHTLVLLDIKSDEQRFMTVNEAVELLLKIEGKRKENVFTKNTLCVGCARIGGKDQLIKAGKASELKNQDFGKPLHCLVIPARKLHFVEEEMLKQW